VTKESALVEYDKRLRAESSGSDSSPAYLATILDTFVLILSDIHVRIEIPIGETRLAAGVMIRGIESFPVDDQERPSFVPAGSQSARRFLKIDGFTVYMEPNASLPDLSALGQTSPSTFILRDFSLTGHAKNELRGNRDRDLFGSGSNRFCTE
jgi:hypothetical protein